MKEGKIKIYISDGDEKRIIEHRDLLNKKGNEETVKNFV